MARLLRIVFVVVVALTGFLHIQANRTCDPVRNARLRRRLSRCESRMQNFFSLTDLPSKCRAGRSTMSCYQRVHTLCPRILPTHIRLSFLNLQSSVTSLCTSSGRESSEETQCPPNVTEQLNLCLGGLTVFFFAQEVLSPEKCPQALSSLECLEIVNESCPNNREVQSLQRLLNMPVLKGNLQRFCNDSVEGEES